MMSPSARSPGTVTPAEICALPDHALQDALRNGLSLWARTTGEKFTVVALDEIVRQQLVSLRRAVTERAPSSSPSAAEPIAPPRHWQDFD